MRRYHPEHQNRIVQMISSVYQEYEFEVYLRGVDNDLLDINKSYIQKNGEFWIETSPEDKSKIIGSIAVQKDIDNKFAAWLQRFYLLPKYRGSGLANKMHHTVIEWCQLNTLNKVHLWSNTRFARAHCFYEKNGYEQKATRSINCGTIPYQEHYFVKLL